MGPDLARLVRECQQGNEVAFAAVYRACADRVYRHLLVLLGPGPEADDCLQLVFETAFKKIHRFDGSSQVTTWLHGIALRTALNARRASRRRARALDSLGHERRPSLRGLLARPDRTAQDRQLLQRLLGYLDALSDKKRTAFLLYYVENLELAEVAARTGASLNTTTARVKHARAELRRALEREQLTDERRLGRTS